MPNCRTERGLLHVVLAVVVRHRPITAFGARQVAVEGFPAGIDVRLFGGTSSSGREKMSVRACPGISRTSSQIQSIAPRRGFDAKLPHRKMASARCAGGCGAPQADYGHWRTAGGRRRLPSGYRCAAVWRNPVFGHREDVIPGLPPCPSGLGPESGQKVQPRPRSKAVAAGL